MCKPRILEGKLPGCVEICLKEALIFGTRDELLKLAWKRISDNPSHYIEHVYGEHEMGGTNWLYISGLPFEQIDMREDLGTTPAPKFTAGALASVPIVVGLWPVLLTGVYAIAKRKDKIAKEEQDTAVKDAIDKATEEMNKQLTQLKDKMTKEQQTAVASEVKKALEEAAQKAKKEAAEEEAAMAEKKSESPDASLDQVNEADIDAPDAGKEEDE